MKLNLKRTKGGENKRMLISHFVCQKRTASLCTPLHHVLSFEAVVRHFPSIKACDVGWLKNAQMNSRDVTNSLSRARAPPHLFTTSAEGATAGAVICLTVRKNHWASWSSAPKILEWLH